MSNGEQSVEHTEHEEHELKEYVPKPHSQGKLPVPKSLSVDSASYTQKHPSRPSITLGDESLQKAKLTDVEPQRPAQRPRNTEIRKAKLHACSVKGSQKSRSDERSISPKPEVIELESRRDNGKVNQAEVDETKRKDNSSNPPAQRPRNTEIRQAKLHAHSLSYQVINAQKLRSGKRSPSPKPEIRSDSRKGQGRISPAEETKRTKSLNSPKMTKPKLGRSSRINNQSLAGEKEEDDTTPLAPGIEVSAGVKDVEPQNLGKYSHGKQLSAKSQSVSSEFNILEDLTLQRTPSIVLEALDDSMQKGSLKDLEPQRPTQRPRSTEIRRAKLHALSLSCRVQDTQTRSDERSTTPKPDLIIMDPRVDQERVNPAENKSTIRRANSWNPPGKTKPQPLSPEMISRVCDHSPDGENEEENTTLLPPAKEDNTKLMDMEPLKPAQRPRNTEIRQAKLHARSLSYRLKEVQKSKSDERSPSPKLDTISPDLRRHQRRVSSDEKENMKRRASSPNLPRKTKPQMLSPQWKRDQSPSGKSEEENIIPLVLTKRENEKMMDMEPQRPAQRPRNTEIRQAKVHAHSLSYRINDTQKSRSDEGSLSLKPDLVGLHLKKDQGRVNPVGKKNVNIVRRTNSWNPPEKIKQQPSTPERIRRLQDQSPARETEENISTFLALDKEENTKLKVIEPQRPAQRPRNTEIRQAKLHAHSLSCRVKDFQKSRCDERSTSPKPNLLGPDSRSSGRVSPAEKDVLPNTI